MAEWPGPELLEVYDPTRQPRARSESGGNLRLPEDELQGLNEQIRRHAGALAQHGVYLVPYSVAGDVQYYSVDQRRAEAFLRARLGANAQLSYLGASLRVLRPHPFGSWLAEGQSLHVFYALGANGEEPGSCVAVEREDCVFVSLTIVDWFGAKTGIGGFSPAHATATLGMELDDRTVIDSVDNRVRPHWTTAAKIALQRPQDL